MTTMSPCTNLHVGLFPFMSKGHTIPLLHLAKRIHKHRPQATFTIFTTPANQPFISTSLSTLPPNLINIITLPFPATNDIPTGVESTDQLPSMSLLNSFYQAIELLQPSFETALESLQNRIDFLISDGFLHWTQQSTSKFNIPRLVSYGMSTYAQTLFRIVMQNNLLDGVEEGDKLIQVPSFPWVEVRKNDFESSVNPTEDQVTNSDLVKKCMIATSKSYGLLVNSVLEFEQPFSEYWSNNIKPTCWCVGPLFLSEKPNFTRSSNLVVWAEWLDRKLAEGKPVLYVAFGSQANVSNEELKEIAIGLENSKVDFIWALRIKPNQEEVMNGFEERVTTRGFIMRGWVEQREILEHEIVKGFLSHCGWNSVIESICAGVPILAMPLMAEQYLNAKMVVEELKVGFGVQNCDRSINWEVLSKMATELIKGEIGRKVRDNVRDLSDVAKCAIEQGGSSWNNLESLLNELEAHKSHS